MLENNQHQPAFESVAQERAGWNGTRCHACGATGPRNRRYVAVAITNGPRARDTRRIELCLACAGQPWARNAAQLIATVDGSPHERTPSIYAISLWQPWATLIALGLKTIETRDWECRHRGPIAIHAGRKSNPGHRAMIREILAEHAPQVNPEAIPFGHVVAVANMINCRQSTGPHEAPSRERPLGDFTRGRWLWILDDVRPLSPTLPVTGRQGIFQVCVPASSIGARISAKR